MSRRSFLVGGAAAIGLTAAGAERIGSDRVLEGLGLRDRRDRHAPPSGWTVEDVSMSSSHLRRRTACAFARPSDDAPLDGAIVCLHGHGEAHRFAFDDVGVHDAVAAAGLRIGVASVAGGSGSYWHARRDGTDAGRMVLDEFVPFVRHRFGVTRLAVLGWSMGGYGALLLSEQSPRTFAATVASSPALWRRPGDTAPGAFDDVADFAAHDVFAMRHRLDLATTRIDCGDHDWFVAATRAFVASLTPGIASSFPPGYHNVEFWRSVAPRQIAFVAEGLRA